MRTQKYKLRGHVLRDKIFRKRVWYVKVTDWWSFCIYDKFSCLLILFVCYLLKHWKMGMCCGSISDLKSFSHIYVMAATSPSSRLLFLLFCFYSILSLSFKTYFPIWRHNRKKFHSDYVPTEKYCVFELVHNAKANPSGNYIKYMLIICLSSQCTKLLIINTAREGLSRLFFSPQPDSAQAAKRGYGISLEGLWNNVTIIRNLVRSKDVHKISRTSVAQSILW